MALTHESLTLPREELEALRRAAPNDARIMQVFVAGWLAQLVDLASVDGPLTPPVEVVILSDDDGNWLPQFRIRLASGLVMEIRVDQAPVGAQFVETLQHGLHGAARVHLPRVWQRADARRDGRHRLRLRHVHVWRPGLRPPGRTAVAHHVLPRTRRTVVTTPVALKTMTFDRHPAGPGPWTDEPDKAQWIDPATDLDCLAVRNNGGAWCGYVGLPPGHPLHGVGYDEVHERLPDLDVHGGLTFADRCHEREDGEGVCHVPEAGRPADVWWLGFDCAHCFDYMPVYARLIPGRVERDETYRTFGYVQAEVAHLAAQLVGRAAT